ncbi:MAG: Radical SAM domain protein [Olavius algarvensis Delta 4 endosymbiont]|nr:MAG: Radical SAM domain protein [Olavius algarvensis Delta 4 endosymbiont]
MPDILLIQPPIQDFYLTRKRTIPYGLACLAGALEKAGFSVAIFDALATHKSKPLPRPAQMAYLQPFYGEPDVSPFALFHQYRHFGYSYQHIERIIRESGAFLVGISSLFTAYSDEASKVAAIVKSVDPGIAVVMGGHHPTALPEAALQSESVDYVIRGEAEESLPALAAALKTGGSLVGISGIVLRQPEGHLQVNDPVWLKNLDDIALPAAHLIKHRYYQRGPRGAAVVVASRGCPLQCSYCAFGADSGYPYRKRSVDAIVREIDQQVRAHDIGFVDFEDENLSMDRRWFLDLMAALKHRYAHRNIELRAMNGLYPPALDDAMVPAMRTAGFKTLNLAVGTTVAGQLKRFNRKDVRSAFEAALQAARRNDLTAVGYIIVGAPDQSAEDSLADLLYLAGHRVLAGVSVFYPAPGSRDYQLCKKRALLPERFDLMRATALPLDQKTNRLESITLLRLGRILNFMKSMQDRGVPVSPRQRAVSGNRPDPADRTAVGIWLLQEFFRSGIIGGLTSEGRLYEHKAAPDLVRMFLEGIQNLDVQGVSS